MSWFAVDTPLWLLALPVAALPLLLTDRHQGGGSRARQAARWLRAIALAALVLALAGPRVRIGGDGVDVAFLLDQSDSTTAQRDQAAAWLERAVAARGPGDRVAVGVFGRDAQVVHGLTDRPPGQRPANVVDGSATDVAQALRLGQGAVGSQRHRRVVVLTDGRQTTGDAAAIAAQLAEAGVGVDVVTTDGGGIADVLVDRVDAPGQVRRGEAYDVAVSLRSTSAEPTTATLVLRADDRVIERRDVTVPPGTSQVTVTRSARQPGIVRYEARLESPASTVAANDVARTAVETAGPARVLVYQRTGGLSDELVRALRASDIGVDVVRADRDPLPGLDRLARYESVVAVDVSVDDLGAGGAQILQTYVRDTGGGLVAIGGDASFGLGGYSGTPLEEVLPVFGRVTDPQRRPPLAEALVVDSSGSMTACHCADDQAMNGGLEIGGVNKTDISREAVARAVDALEAQDTLGVLAFNRSNDWVVPLQRLPSDEVVDEGLARIHPRGDTAIAQAVREAIAGLVDTDARLRHIVLFTDGFTAESSGGLVDVAQEAADAGITLSVVATGEGPPELQRTLERMAETGGGRYYAGRDLQSVPNIIALELRTAARRIINEGRFVPAITAAGPATENLDAAPPLLGYLATTAKPTARTALRIGEERDPLLATWRVGLGTSTAWLSDANARWSAGWVDWRGYASFWSAVVRETFPEADDDRGELTATVIPDGIDLRVRATADLPADATASASVTGPDGRRVEVPLERVDLQTFAGTADADDGGLVGEGVYAASAVVEAGGREQYRGTATATRSYPAEYAVSDVDPGLLDRLTSAETARLNPAPEDAFDPALLPAGDARQPLWPWLLLLALILAPIDVGLRRLRLERADFARARQWLRTRARPRGQPPPDTPAERDAATESLFAAKRRAAAQATNAPAAPGKAPDAAPDQVSEPLSGKSHDAAPIQPADDPPAGDVDR